MFYVFYTKTSGNSGFVAGHMEFLTMEAAEAALEKLKKVGFTSSYIIPKF